MMKKVLLLIIIVFINVCQSKTLKAQCIPVSISTQPTNQNDSVPGHAHFNIIVTGTAPYNYYWYVNGTLIDSTINSASTSNTYNTPSLIMADSNNTYYCVVTNCAGANTITSNIVGLICIPVSISIQPLSQTFTAGNNDTISFSVTVNGTPPFSYHWYGPSGLVKTTIDTAGHRSIYSFYANPVVYGMNGNTYHVVISNCHHGIGSGSGGNQVVSNNAVVTVSCPSMPAPAVYCSGNFISTGNHWAEICGQSYVLFQTPAVIGTTYHWSGTDGLNSSLQNPTDNITAFFNCPTTYTFTLTETLNGCTSSQGYFNIEIWPIPTINNPPANQIICSGGTLAIVPDVFCGVYFGPGTYQYTHTTNSCITGATTSNWSQGINDILINTGTTPCSITYTINAVMASGACQGPSVSFAVTVNPAPQVTVTSPTICAGDTATITANGASTYTWSAGATPAGIDTAMASPASTHTYTVTGTNTYGCHNTAISTVTVLNTLNTAVTQTADTLMSNQSGATYQWYNCAINGLQQITGATNQTYVPPVNGQYAVAVSLGSCLDTSACQLFYSVGLNQLTIDNVELIISPNPFTEQTTITSTMNKITSIKIMDVMGQCVLAPPPSLQGGGKGVVVDMSGFANGIYFLQVQTEQTLINKKIVLQ